jgi:hypothetical protein
LLVARGEVSGLPVREIALQPRGHLKTVDVRHSVGDHDGERLRHAGRIRLPVGEVDLDVAAAPIQRGRIVTRGAGTLVVSRRAGDPRVGAVCVGVQQHHGRDHREDGPSDPGLEHVTGPRD